MTPAEIAQLARAMTELATLKTDLESSRRELESVQQQLAAQKSPVQNPPGQPDQYLVGLGRDRRLVEQGRSGAQNDNVRRGFPIGRCVALTLLTNVLALGAAAYWVHQNMPAEFQALIAAYQSHRPAESGDRRPSQPATNVAPVPVTDAPAEATPALIAATIPVASVPPASASPALTPPPLGDNLPPAQRELVLLKERNRLTAYADEAIATGVRASYDRLWEALHDPRLANLVHATRAEIIRVQHAYLGGSRIDRFDIPVGAYFPEESALTDGQLKDRQLIKLLSDPTNPWEVRMKAANLLGTRRSIEAGDALVQAVKSDANLDVVKEATFSFDQMTGYHGKIFDAASLEKWWQQYKANPKLRLPDTEGPPVSNSNLPGAALGQADAPPVANR
jgi:hypothetical protein